MEPRIIVALTARERETIRCRLLEWFSDTGHTRRYLAAKLNVPLGAVGNFCTNGTAGSTFLSALLRELPALAAGIPVHVIGSR